MSSSSAMRDLGRDALGDARHTGDDADVELLAQVAHDVRVGQVERR